MSLHVTVLIHCKHFLTSHGTEPTQENLLSWFLISLVQKPNLNAFGAVGKQLNPIGFSHN